MDLFARPRTPASTTDFSTPSYGTDDDGGDDDDDHGAPSSITCRTQREGLLRAQPHARYERTPSALSRAPRSGVRTGRRVSDPALENVAERAASVYLRGGWWRVRDNTRPRARGGGGRSRYKDASRRFVSGLSRLSGSSVMRTSSRGCSGRFFPPVFAGVNLDWFESGRGARYVRFHSTLHHSAARKREVLLCFWTSAKSAARLITMCNHVGRSRASFLALLTARALN